MATPVTSTKGGISVSRKNVLHKNTSMTLRVKASGKWLPKKDNEGWTILATVIF